MSTVRFTIYGSFYGFIEKIENSAGDYNMGNEGKRGRVEEGKRGRGKRGKGEEGSWGKRGRGKGEEGSRGKRGRGSRREKGERGEGEHLQWTSN